ncbi:unnamed protein product [Bursaphelenchus xylophilus]|uniref:(pine wood nematode) hypothetical protein n=1 Tax=Bursaphelenchus xylophilus TaxID=6326 RepID=A0A1I7RNN6_BURXY|nr:unnamed protein product [Bursaphelenchus xylophilus]CAG9124184.1 unnamed protein product [Bursaphelenchus xylophilus]
MNYRPKQSQNSYYGQGYGKSYGKDYGQRDKPQGEQKSYYNDRKYYYDHRKYDSNDQRGDKYVSYDTHYPPHSEQSYYDTPRGQGKYHYIQGDRRFRDRNGFPCTSGSSPSHQNYSGPKIHEDHSRNRVQTDSKSTQTDEAYSPVNSHTQTCSCINGIGNNLSDTTFEEVFERHLEYKEAIRKIQFQQPTLTINISMPEEYDPKVIQQYYRWDPIINDVLFDESSVDGPMDTHGYQFWSENSTSSRYQWKRGSPKG